MKKTISDKEKKGKATGLGGTNLQITKYISNV